MSNDEDKDSAAVKGRPPLYMLAGIIITWILEEYIFSLSLNWDTVSAKVVGWGLIVIGFGISVSVAQAMRSKGTSILPHTPTTALLTTGIFLITRNPVYLSNGIVIAGASVLFNTWWGILAMMFNWGLSYYWAIKPEEAYLEAKFCKQYLEYKSKVRRWI